MSVIHVEHTTRELHCLYVFVKTPLERHLYKTLEISLKNKIEQKLDSKKNTLFYKNQEISSMLSVLILYQCFSLKFICSYKPFLYTAQQLPQNIKHDMGFLFSLHFMSHVYYIIIKVQKWLLVCFFGKSS